MADAERAAFLARAPKRRPVHDLSGLDGFVTALVIGPRFVEPPQWIGELLGGRAFLAGAETPEASAIQAIVARYNHLSMTLSVEPDRYQPLLARHPDGSPDAAAWAGGFMAAVEPRRQDWRDLLDGPGARRSLLAPILLHDAAGLDALRFSPTAKAYLDETCGRIRSTVIAAREFWAPRRNSGV
jgi:uncharacterized protein